MTKAQERKIKRIESQAKLLEKKLVKGVVSPLQRFNSDIKTDIGNDAKIDTCRQYYSNVNMHGVITNKTLHAWKIDDPIDACQQYGGAVNDKTSDYHEYYTLSDEDDSDWNLPEGMEDAGYTYGANAVTDSDTDFIINQVQHYLNGAHTVTKKDVQRQLNDKKQLINILKMKSTSAQIKAYLKYRPCAYKSVPKTLALNKNWSHKFLHTMSYLNKHNSSLSKIYRHADVNRSVGISINDWYKRLTKKLKYNFKNYYHVQDLICDIKNNLYLSLIHRNNKSMSKSKYDKALRTQQRLEKYRQFQKSVFRQFGFTNVTKDVFYDLLKKLFTDMDDSYILSSIKSKEFKKAYHKYNQKVTRKQTRKLNRDKRNYVHQRTVFLRKLGKLMAE